MRKYPEIKVLFLPASRGHAVRVKIVTRAQMIEAEQAAFATGFVAAALMESAGKQMADFVRQNHPRPGSCRVFAGKGHNGGDVLVAARHLAAAGWGVETVVPDKLNWFNQQYLKKLSNEELTDKLSKFKLMFFSFGLLLIANLQKILTS